MDVNLLDRDIAIVMTQARVTRDKAIEGLISCEYNIVDTIMQLTDSTKIVLPPVPEFKGMTIQKIETQLQSRFDVSVTCQSNFMDFWYEFIITLQQEPHISLRLNYIHCSIEPSYYWLSVGDEKYYLDDAEGIFKLCNKTVSDIGSGDDDSDYDPYEDDIKSKYFSSLNELYQWLRDTASIAKRQFISSIKFGGKCR